MGRVCCSLLLFVFVCLWLLLIGAVGWSCWLRFACSLFADGCGLLVLVVVVCACSLFVFFRCLPLFVIVVRFHSIVVCSLVLFVVARCYYVLPVVVVVCC